MAITTNEYFKDEIYISQAKPSLSAGVTGASLSIIKFIAKYERDCLIKVLGKILYAEFLSQLDSGQANGIKAGADAKWDKLLNGTDYVNPDGDNVNWKGIRQESVKDAGYDMSFIANYIYTFYERNNDKLTGSVGHGRGNAKNMEMRNATTEIVRAWRSFVQDVQGRTTQPQLYSTTFGLGVDYYGGDEDITLYGFINDSNSLIEDTYADFKPKSWKVGTNSMGI